ncbi:hypothetical protein A9G15_04145 [Gilliamella apis]|uniref:hypothetical protein n=1 Tax=Gilliamella apis TaxID=1970738 RepID=UPI00080E862B|nr:hypothetical protein [Gilliamella apis]OCG04297.1 hypothetical protein A9G15_04145 [Gilliamella apis]
MTSNEVKERLLQKNWYVECKTKQDTDLVLQACDDAGIIWQEGNKATTWSPLKKYPLYITFYKRKSGITYDYNAYYDSYEEYGLENITDWFFNAIKNNDSKLTPQNAEQEHLVQVLLAKMQGMHIEEYNDDNCFWHPSDSNCIFLNTEYRIVPKPTPFITREMWAMIAPKWKWAAMDRDGEVYFYTDEPCISASGFSWTACGSDYCDSVLAINIDGINWKRSLTERPEDV